MNTIYVPFLNPIKYQELTAVQIPQYMSKHMEKYRFITTLKEWVEQIDYGQLFQTNDHISQQMLSELGRPELTLLNDKNEELFQDLFEQKLQNKNQPGQWAVEHDLDLSGLDLHCGVYYLKLSVGSTSPTVLISEPIFICESVEDSLLLEYRHHEFKGDVFFETGYSPSVRFLGTLKYKTPASKETIYEDQELNETLLHSDEYDVWELIIGGSYGIPPYLIRRLNRMFGCSFKSIDGIRYEKNDGAKWEQKEIENYPLRGLSIELREVINRSSQVYENGALQTQHISVIAALDTKGFSNQSTGSEYRITDVI